MVRGEGAGGPAKSIDSREDRQQTGNCGAIQEQTSKATFRQTASSFRESARQWDDKVKRNKKAIWDKDESDKDKIMDFHLDLRLANNSTSKISERMTSLRSQARELTSDAI